MIVKNPYPGLRVRWMLISVATAARWLKGNIRNRPMKPRWVGQYCHDIAMKRWGLSESCIVIAKTGAILNGQHRLEAIVSSQTPIWQVVVTGVPEEVIFDMDQGRRRSFTDAYNLLHAGNGRIQNRDKAMATYAFLSNAFVSPGAVAPTHHDNHEVFEKHKKAILWAREALGGKSLRGITVSPITGAFCRAYYHAVKNNQLDRLAEFAHVLVSGEANGPKDQAAIKLRNYAIQQEGVASGGRGPRELLYRKTETAILAFLKSERLKSLSPAKKEAFHVPHE